jgi:hypothetical protein
MAVVLRLADVLDINYIAPEKTIVLTTRTIIYEIVVNNDAVAKGLIDSMQKAMVKDPLVKKETRLPRFYNEGGS